MTDETVPPAPPPSDPPPSGSLGPDPVFVEWDRDTDKVPRVAVNEPVKPSLIAVDPWMLPSLLVNPPGFTVCNTNSAIVEWYARQPTPPRRRGTFNAATIQSFTDWLKNNTTDTAPVFAAGSETLSENWAEPELALIGIGNYSSGMDPQWHDLKAVYHFPVTAAWIAWCNGNACWMTQAQFAEFMEEHLYEVSEPLSGEPLSEAVTRMIESLGGTKSVGSPSQMFEVAHGVAITMTDSVEVEVNRSSGERVLKFTEQHTGKGGRPLAIPRFFYIRLPIFHGEAPQLIGVLLRYKNAGGGCVQWSYELFAPELVVQQAFEQAAQVVIDAGRTLYYGSPDLPGN
jgi:hypothetical protein